MELEEALRVLPSDYLREGFLSDEGTIRDGINGIYSLALAYQSRNEGIDLDKFQQVVEQLKAPSPDLERVRNSIATLESRSLQNLVDAAGPWLSDPQQYKAFVSHLQRILQQTALVTLTPTEETME